MRWALRGMNKRQAGGRPTLLFLRNTGELINYSDKVRNPTLNER